MPIPSSRKAAIAIREAGVVCTASGVFLDSRCPLSVAAMTKVIACTCRDFTGQAAFVLTAGPITMLDKRQSTLLFLVLALQIGYGVLL